MYKLIYHSSSIKLEELVCALLKDGWELQGGVASTEAGWAQALIKKEPEAPPKKNTPVGAKPKTTQSRKRTTPNKSCDSGKGAPRRSSKQFST